MTSETPETTQTPSRQPNPQQKVVPEMPAFSPIG